MSKRRKKSSTTDEFEIQLKPYQKVLLGILWLASVIVVMLRTVQTNQGNWITGLLVLGGIWLMFSVLITLMGLGEILLDKMVPGALSRISMKVTSGNGMNGIINTCIGVIYIITVFVAGLMLFVSPSH